MRVRVQSARRDRRSCVGSYSFLVLAVPIFESTDASTRNLLQCLVSAVAGARRSSPSVGVGFIPSCLSFVFFLPILVYFDIAMSR